MLLPLNFPEQMRVNVELACCLQTHLPPYFHKCMATPKQKLTALLSSIQNCPATEAGAREMESKVQEAISHLQSLTLSEDPLLSMRAKASQRGLQTDVLHYLEQYWHTDDKVNRMSKIAQARAQACLLLEQVLATAKK